MLRLLLAVLLTATAWLLRMPLEQTMLSHMLIQWPMLVAAGLLVMPRSRSTAVEWNWMGIPGLLLASTALLVWMLPLMLDRAVDNTAADVLKCASLAAAGMVGGWSWRLAPMPVKLFFAGNALWMTATIGVILQSTRTPLCTSYLVNDQGWTGIGLVLMACVLGLIGGVPLLRASGMLDASDTPRRSAQRLLTERPTRPV